MDEMLKDAIVQRMKDICGEKGISYTELARRAGMTPSTIYSLIDPERKDVSAITVKKICDGLEMTLGEFYSTKEFDELEQEIQ